MVSVTADALAQVAGAFLLVLGLAIWSPAVALIVGGLLLMVFGAVAEAERKRKRGMDAR